MLTTLLQANAGPRLSLSTLGAIMMSTGPRRVIDSHLHVWSDGKEPYPWVVEPPEELKTTATFETLRDAAQAAGVKGALTTAVGVPQI